MSGVNRSDRNRGEFCKEINGRTKSEHRKAKGTRGGGERFTGRTHNPLPMLTPLNLQTRSLADKLLEAS
jgi:hypothetical protein